MQIVRTKESPKRTQFIILVGINVQPKIGHVAKFLGITDLSKITAKAKLGKRTKRVYVKVLVTK